VRARRKPPLTLKRIVDTAVTLLDEHGIEGLTMRCLAQQLDVTATALYWHVRTKDDVLDLAVDRIFGDVPIPDVSDNWLEDIRVGFPLRCGHPETGRWSRGRGVPVGASIEVHGRVPA
jgi:AcrR family transcriptional regulator